MRILVTGSSGAVGSATIQALHPMMVLPKGVELVGEPDRVIPFDLMDGRDIRQVKHLRQVIEDTEPDRILHLAAVARFADADADPERAYTTNVIGTEVVAQEAAYHSIPLVYASTGSVYMPVEQVPPITEDFQARGNSVYGVSKYLGELMVRKIRSPWIILRYAHIYGSQKLGKGLVGSFLERMNRGLAPTLYGGWQSNDFTYIEDIAQANLKALTAPWDAWNQVYNIGTGEELTAEDAMDTIAEVFDYSGPIEHQGSRSVDAQRFVYDVSKATERLGFTAEYGFRQGLEDMREGMVPFE
jgi:nucleoside-diphosphate-sugar epimerase